MLSSMICAAYSRLFREALHDASEILQIAIDHSTEYRFWQCIFIIL